jgi:hypothetical protein
MPRVILLAGILALLAAAGATTAFRVTEPEVTRPAFKKQFLRIPAQRAFGMLDDNALFEFLLFHSERTAKWLFLPFAARIT